MDFHGILRDLKGNLRDLNGILMGFQGILSDLRDVDTILYVFFYYLLGWNGDF